MKFGVGLRPPYLDFFEKTAAHSDIDFLEIHPENYIYNPASKKRLYTIAEKYPISFHCVSLSLGSNEGWNDDFLQRLKELEREIQPFLCSDHLAWNKLDGISYLDLFPIPLTEESLSLVCARVEKIQTILNRQILIENPSTYLQFQESTFLESVFLSEVSKKTGCGILFDVNNLYVQHINHGISIEAYINTLSWDAIQEIHLAGHTYQNDYIIDTHDTFVSKEVLNLYQSILPNTKKESASLLEWDQKYPSIDVLLDELLRIKTRYTSFFCKEDPRF